MPIIEPQKPRRQRIFSDVAHLVIVDVVQSLAPIQSSVYSAFPNSP